MRQTKIERKGQENWHTGMQQTCCGWGPPAGPGAGWLVCWEADGVVMSLTDFTPPSAVVQGEIERTDELLPGFEEEKKKGRKKKAEAAAAAPGGAAGPAAGAPAAGGAADRGAPKVRCHR